KLGDRLDDDVSAARGGVADGDSRSQQGEIDELTSVYRQILDLVFINNRTDHGAGRFGHFADVLHRDFLKQLSDGQIEIHVADGADVEMDLLGSFLKTTLLRGDDVIAGRQRGDLVITRGSSGHSAGEPRGCVGSGNVGIRNRRTAGIEDATLHRHIDQLRAQGRRRV